MRWLFVALVAVAVLTAPAPSEAQSDQCPLVSDAELSGAVGEPAQVSVLLGGVQVREADTACFFESSQYILYVRRWPEAFAVGEAGAITAEHLDRLRLLVGSDVALTPVDGLGDGAGSAVVDQSSMLAVKRGREAFAFGILGVPDAQGLATSMARVVLARP
jgi:hypothetical protein